jgi:LSD1 subclass zinc finger protein
MSVFTCADCGGTVSKRAAACPHCGAPAAGALPRLHPAAPDGGGDVCLTCYSVVHAKRETKGPAWIGWVLLPFYLLPGILYFVWRSRSQRAVCPRCGSEALVPATSARAIEIISGTAAAKISSGGGRIETCPSCLLPVNFPAGARRVPCPHCTTNLTLTDTGSIETD